MIIQTSRTWELVYISYEASPGNQTGENDSSSFRDSSRPPLKGGSIHFHHQKTRNAKVHHWDSSLFSWQVFKSPLDRSSNLLLAGLQISSWQVFKSLLGRSSNLLMAGLQKKQMFSHPSHTLLLLL